MEGIVLLDTYFAVSNKQGTGVIRLDGRLKPWDTDLSSLTAFKSLEILSPNFYEGVSYATKVRFSWMPIGGREKLLKCETDVYNMMSLMTSASYLEGIKHSIQKLDTRWHQRKERVIHKMTSIDISAAPPVTLDKKDKVRYTNISARIVLYVGNRK